jgi:hypothetical protein
MIEFEVSDAFEFPTKRDRNGVWHVPLPDLNDFWKDCDPNSLGMRNGCYIFGISTKKIKPWYVGKTWKGFRNEAFKSYQQTKISRFINEHGTPVVVFVYKKYKAKEGKRTRKIIRSLENFLIQSSVSVNPNLLNIHGVNAEWSIRGVIRSTQKGKTPFALKEFTRMIGIS